MNVRPVECDAVVASAVLGPYRRPVINVGADALRSIDLDGDPYVTPMSRAAPPPADPLAPAAASGWTAPSTTDQGRSAGRAARAERHAARSSRDGAPGTLIVGTLLVLLGIFFLAREFLPQIDFDWFWPLVLVGVGVVVVVSALGRGPGDDTST